MSTATPPVELRLLVVDDAQEEASLYGWYLQKVKRYKVDIDYADNGKKGIEKLENGQYDIVFTDYRMPVMDGIAFLAEVSKRGFVIPIVFLTGAGDEIVAANAIKLGAMEYLRKRDLPRVDFASLLDRALAAKKKQAEVEEKEEFGEVRDKLISQLSLELQSTLDSLQRFGSEVPKADLKKADGLEESYKDLRQAGIHLDGLLEDLNNLRTVMAPAGYKPRPVILRELLSAALERKRHLMEAKGILVEPHLPQRDIHVKVDNAALQVVLENLISNAVAYSPANATLTIKAERFSSGLVRLSLHNPGRALPVGALVRMLGHSKLPATPQTVATDGLGLGLRICRKIVETHGGQLWLETNGQGATAYLTLPTPPKK